MSGIELAPGSKIFTARCKNLYVLTTKHKITAKNKINKIKIEDPFERIVTVIDKIGHIARDCKFPKNPKKKQISEIIIDDEKYTQIEFIDYELESEDSIYEISENEMNNDIEIESDNEFYNITND